MLIGGNVAVNFFYFRRMKKVIITKKHFRLMLKIYQKIYKKVFPNAAFHEICLKWARI